MAESAAAYQTEQLGEAAENTIVSMSKMVSFLQISGHMDEATAVGER